jgi:hypothetical protein
MGAGRRDISGGLQDFGTAQRVGAEMHIEQRYGVASHDAARLRTVLFGGRGGGGETWQWDRSVWTRVSTDRPRAARPSRGAGRRNAWDGPGFGGSRAACTGAGSLAISGDGNGSTWTHVSDTVPPARGGAHAMAYDRTRGVTVLMGGGTSAGQLDDLWEWSGRIGPGGVEYPTGFGRSPRAARACSLR